MRRPSQFYFHVPVEMIKQASPHSKGCCAECQHFFPTGMDTDREGFLGCAVLGQCHRSAPNSDGGFPKVYAHSFCGDFEMVVEEELPFAINKR